MNSLPRYTTTYYTRVTWGGETAVDTFKEEKFCLLYSKDMSLSVLVVVAVFKIQASITDLPRTLDIRSHEL